jgi:DNA polymerase III epsilon subunit-like protein
MSWIVVDVESDGPIPPEFSMICFGAVVLDADLNKTFYGEVAPISERTDPAAAAISGICRAKHATFEDPATVMTRFAEWIRVSSKGRPIFVSDNPAFDWQWINYYFHKYTGANPFGYSARRIGDLYCGLVKNPYARWKHLRKTNHDHNPVNDAKGNAEALLAMRNLGLPLRFE